jgi:iron complex outermembrane recepter protein
MKLSMSVLTGSAIAALALTLVAQADVPSQVEGLEDIIVTARRVEEPLQDVPISISVLNAQQLENHNLANAEDLAKYIPSLEAGTNFGSNNSTFAIRGFSQDISTQPTVGVYFAEVVAPRGPTQGTAAGDGAGPGSFFDLQNIQVLKGPQGTLFGRNTTGGAILLVPQKPEDKLGGYLEVSDGNYAMKRIQAALNVPLADWARFRIAFDRQTRDGYLNNDSGIGPSTFDNVHYDAVRASMVLNLTPNVENYTIGSYSRSPTTGDVEKAIACNPASFLGQLTCAQLAAEQAKGAGFYTVQSDWPDPQSVLMQWQAINTTTWHASDALTVKNIVSYAQLKDFESSAYFGTNWKLGGVVIPFTSINPAPGLWTADSSTTTEELQIQGSALDQRLTYQSGIYFEAVQPLALVGSLTPGFATCESLTPINCVPLLPGAASVNYTAGKEEYRDYGIYSQASYSLTSQLKLTGGLRYTQDRVSDTTYRITNSITAPGQIDSYCTDASQLLPACAESLEQKSHAPTWLVDLDYKPVDDVLFYAKYARGYRAGGIDNAAPSNYRVYNPEKDDDFELGAKTSFGGDLHGIFDVDAFYNNLSNQQLPVDFNAVPGAAVSPTSGIVNAAKSRIYGVEVNTSIIPVRGVRVDVDYTYLNATIRSIAPLASTDPNFTLSGEVLPGDSLALSPKNKVSSTTTYTLPFDEHIGKISVSATFTHTDKQRTSYTYNDPATLAAFGTDLGILAPRNLLDLNLNWYEVAHKPFDVSMFATNVTDQHYYSFVPGLGGYGLETAVLGQPRMYGGRIRYHF